MVKRQPEERSAQVGELFALPVPGGRFGVVQVRALAGEDRVELITLEGLFKAVPRARELAEAKVVRRNWGSWHGAAERVIADRRVPWNALRIGALPVAEHFS